jgi:NADH:ubiquinone oxidoreductase subunit 6 (subunit J)
MVVIIVVFHEITISNIQIAAHLLKKNAFSPTAPHPKSLKVIRAIRATRYVVLFSLIQLLLLSAFF